LGLGVHYFQTHPHDLHGKIGLVPGQDFPNQTNPLSPSNWVEPVVETEQKTHF